MIKPRIFKGSRGRKLGIGGAAVMAATLGVTATFTLGGFSAGVGSNSASNFSSATVQLEEGNGSTTCFSTGTGSGGSVGSSNSNTSCAVNDLTGSLDQVPGGTALTSTITLTDVGNHTPSTASLTVGSCTVSSASDNGTYEGSDTSGFCGKVDVTIANTTSSATDPCVYPTSTSACPGLSSTYTLTTLAAAGSFSSTPLSIPAASGGTATYVISVQLDASATNADQGLEATLPFTWSISQ